MRVAHAGDKNPMAGDKWHRTAEGAESFRQKRSSENHHYYGKERDEETKDKISQKLKGRPMSDEEKVKRSEGLKRMWERRRNGEIPNRKVNGTKVIK